MTDSRSLVFDDLHEREDPDPSEGQQILSGITESGVEDPPPNPAGGKTLIVDPTNRAYYATASAALQDAGSDDLVFIRPGVYEDRIFISERPVQLVGAGKDKVQIFSRRSGPLYLQRVPNGRISGITFRYVGSDQHSAINIADSSCTITQCRVTDGLLSGIVLYGPNCRPAFLENEVCDNRESGIFVFAGAQPYITKNICFGNHHFGIAVRDDGTLPDLAQNLCRDNMLSGILLFHDARATLLRNESRDNCQWGMVMTPDCKTTPERDQLAEANILEPNPRGALYVTTQPLADIGR